MRKHIFHPLVIISLLHVIISFFLFHEHGVKNVTDSHRYLEYANNLKNGFYFDNHNFWYLGYVVFLFIIKLFFNSELAIIIAQYMLSWVAVVCIYKCSKLIHSNSNVAFVSALYYVFFIEILSWNLYILCESVYSSFICISFYLLAKVYRDAYNLTTIIFTVLFITLTTLTKPTGISLLVAVFIIVLSKLNFRSYNKTLSPLMIVIVSTIIVLLANKMLTTYLILENYQLGEIIYGITSMDYKPEYDFIVVMVPNDIYIPTLNSQPILTILDFIIHNPIYWIKLFCGKIFYFLFHVRPYWSMQHNIFSLLMIFPLYFCTIRGIIRGAYNKQLLIFFLGYAFIHIVIVGITSVDWDGRFLMPLLLALFIMASPEIFVDVKRVFSKYYSSKS